MVLQLAFLNTGFPSPSSRGC